MSILTYLPLAMGLLVCGFYLMNPDERLQRAGALLRWATALCATALFVYMVTLFLGRHYEFRYVYENTSQDLNFMYRLSAVWAGQAGTFLMWYWFTAVILVFMVRLGKLENAAYAAVGFVLTLIGVFHVLASPFELLPLQEIENLRQQITHGLIPSSLLNTHGMPADGRGLNPILKNPWMAIHPPLIFIGYGLAAAPAALAAAGVAVSDITGWARRARSWTALAWAFLGAGIFCGSYWAYIILGWGGYWGWDPVENASLLPWIALAALAHGLIVQGGRRRFANWNIALAFLPLIMVFLTTFLTRSGALAEFSVHSFERGLLYYPIAMALFAALAVGLAFWSFAVVKRVAGAGPGETLRWGPRLLTWTVLLLIMFLGFVMIGTLFPLISKVDFLESVPLVSSVFKQGVSAVDSSYYNKTAFFSMFLIAGILVICPFLFVPAPKAGTRLRGILCVAGAVAGAGILAAASPQFPSGVARFLSYVLAAAAGASVGVNAVSLQHFIRLRRWTLGGYAVHAGMGLMVLGILTSGFGGREESMRLTTGQTHKGKLANITLTRVEMDPKQSVATAYLDIRRGGSVKLTALHFNLGGARRAPTPAIVSSAVSDLYVIPEGLSTGGGMGAHGGMGAMDGQGAPDASESPALEMPDGDMVTRNKPVSAGNSQLLLKGWDLNSTDMQKGRVGVILQVTTGGASREIVVPFEAMSGGQGGEGVALEDGTRIRVLRINVNKSQPDTEFAVLDIEGPQSRAPQAAPRRRQARRPTQGGIILASYSVAAAPAMPPATPEAPMQAPDEQQAAPAGDEMDPAMQMPPSHPPMDGGDMGGDMGGMGGMGGGMAMPPGHPATGGGMRAPAIDYQIDIRVMTKPFIALLWLGMALITAGALAASFRKEKSE